MCILIFVSSIFVGGILTKLCCRSFQVTINGKDHRAQQEQKNIKLLSQQMSVSRGVETTLGPVEVLIPPTFWKNWLEICRTGTVVHCSPLCHYTRHSRIWTSNLPSRRQFPDNPSFDCCLVIPNRALVDTRCLSHAPPARSRLWP